MWKKEVPQKNEMNKVIGQREKERAEWQKKQKNTRRYHKISCLCIVLISLIVTGCKKTNETKITETKVVTVNDFNVYLDEMMYYIWQTETEYDSYNDYYEENYGVNFWEQDAGDGLTARDFIKDDVMDNVVQNYILWDQAVAAGITLTKEEQETSKTKAQEILTGFTEKQKGTIQLSEERLTEILEKEALVDKFFNETLESYKVDEEQIRTELEEQMEKEYEVDAISIPKDELLEDETNPYDAMNQMLEQAKITEDWSTLVEDSESPFIYETYTITENDTVCPEKIKREVFNQKTGDITPMIETEEEYVIVKIINDNATKSYETSIENAIENQKLTEFNTYYEELRNKYTIIIEEEVWGTIEIGTLTLDKPEKEQ